MSQAQALRRAWRDGAYGALSETYLHRAQREDALGHIVGREAIVAEAIAIEAAFASLDVAVRHDGTEVCSIELQGRYTGGLLGIEGEGAEVRLRQHRWSRRERTHVVEDIVVSDHLALVDALGASRAEVAQAVGAAAPTQPPLGELRSGQGQLAVEPLGSGDRTLDTLHAIWNGRHFDRIANIYAADATWTGPGGRSGGRDDLRTWLCQLVAQLPDATVLIDRTEAFDGGLAILWRLFGHRGGRRVRLIGSTILTLSDGKIVADDTLVDELALLATPYRPLLTL